MSESVQAVVTECHRSGDFKETDRFLIVPEAEGPDQGPGAWRGFLVQDSAFPLCPHGVGGEGAPWAFSYEDTNPLMGAPPSGPKSPPAGPSSSTSTWGICFQHTNLLVGWGAQKFCPQHRASTVGGNQVTVAQHCHLHQEQTPDPAAVGGGRGEGSSFDHVLLRGLKVLQQESITFC